MESRKLTGVLTFTSLVALHAQAAWAQLVGGDEIQTTVSNAGTYLQRIAMLFFVITLIIGALRMTSSSNKEGLSMVVGSIIGIAVTALASQIVTIVQSWTGGAAVLGF